MEDAPIVLWAQAVFHRRVARASFLSQSTVFLSRHSSIFELSTAPRPEPRPLLTWFEGGQGRRNTAELEFEYFSQFGWLWEMRLKAVNFLVKS